MVGRYGVSDNFHLLSYNLHAEENRGRNAPVLLRCGAFIFVLSGFIRIDDESYIWSKSERISAKYGVR